MFERGERYGGKTVDKAFYLSSIPHFAGANKVTFYEIS